MSKIENAVCRWILTSQRILRSFPLKRWIWKGQRIFLKQPFSIHLQRLTDFIDGSVDAFILNGLTVYIKWDTIH
jgi:hypothetical protein